MLFSLNPKRKLLKFNQRKIRFFWGGGKLKILGFWRNKSVISSQSPLGSTLDDLIIEYNMYYTQSLFTMIVLRIHSTQKPQYSKTVVLKNRSLKSRSIQKPQYSKTEVLKIRSTQKQQYLKYDCCEKKNVDQKWRHLPKFSKSSSKTLYYLCVSHGTLRNSMTTRRSVKFHLVQVVRLFSKLKKL